MKTDQQTTDFTMTPLAIVGIGSMFPDAENSHQFWTNIKTGVDSIREVPESHWRADDYFDADPKSRDKVYAKLGGFLSPVSLMIHTCFGCNLIPISEKISFSGWKSA